ncbi:MAG TPA: helix-turn-helix domain-containing protein, partial [Sumerlaeia bacterium]|nr:helix-turn-helix domain-containing protein [Sumerlaeia bacterium]
VMDRFLEHPWPGNIRELENVIQRALIMASGAMIQIEDLPPSLCGAAQAASSADREDGRVDFSVPMPRHVENAVEATERRLIAEALRRSRGRQEAADALGISRKSLHNKMQKYGMR